MNDPPPFPITHENLDREEAELLAEIDNLGRVPLGSPDAFFARAVRWADIGLLSMLDEWRRELLEEEAANAKSRPPS